jgi:hypothetical protein
MAGGIADDGKPATDSVGSLIATEFPTREFPVVFADGVSTTAHGPGFVKFYLYRTDPSMQATGRSNIMPFAQVVMTINGFASMNALFQGEIKRLIADGLLDIQTYEHMDETQKAADAKRAAQAKGSTS